MNPGIIQVRSLSDVCLLLKESSLIACTCLVVVSHVLLMFLEGSFCNHNHVQCSSVIEFALLFLLIVLSIRVKYL